MKRKSVYDADFSRYGKVLTGYDWTELIEALKKDTPLPEEGTVYEASDPNLEKTGVYSELMCRMYGGMPIQIGYCNGRNTRLNCVEYHRDSEVNVAADDMVLLVGAEQDIRDGQYDTAKIEAFTCPKGTGVELYATTLHYAPCADEGFRVAIVLPKGTNTDQPSFEPANTEDNWMRAKNKWLLAHPEAPEAKDGAYVGLVGGNPDILED